MALAPGTRLRIATTLHRTARFLRLTPPGRALLKDLNYEITTLLVALSETDPQHPILNSVIAQRDEVLRKDHNHPSRRRSKSHQSKMPSRSHPSSRSRSPFIPNASIRDSVATPSNLHMTGALPPGSTSTPGPNHPRSPDGEHDGITRETSQTRHRRRRYKRPQPPEFSWRKGFMAFVQETVEYEVARQTHQARKERHRRREVKRSESSRGRTRQRRGDGDAPDNAGSETGGEDERPQSDVRDFALNEQPSHVPTEVIDHEYRQHLADAQADAQVREHGDASTRPSQIWRSLSRQASRPDSLTVSSLGTQGRARRLREPARIAASVTTSTSTLQLPGLNAPPVSERQRRDFYGLTRGM